MDDLSPKLFRNAQLPAARTSRYFRIDEQGNLQPLHTGALTKQQIASGAFAALACDYMPVINPDTKQPYPDEEQYLGMTNAEVLWHRLGVRAAQGDMDAIGIMLDRTLGKAKQHVEAVTVTGTFQDYLDSIAEQEGTPVVRSTTYDVDAEATDISDVEGWL